ncbi:hypothetical protein SLA2020_205550 [Shorea laevis]
MSWLARSIANSLRLDDDDDAGDENNAVNSERPIDSKSHQSSPSHSNPPSSTGPDSPRGVKEDLSELTKSLSRQFWGVASFLAPPPSESSNQSELDRSSDPEASDEDVLGGIRSDFAEIGGRFRTGISKLSNNIAVSEITKIASNFMQFGSEEESLEKYRDGNVVGVTEDVVLFARDIAMHPGTWLDFPVPNHADFDDFDMSDAQQDHALAVEHLAPRLAALRIELCPEYMSEGCFWKIYFVLLHPRLNNHDAELLSTPQIVETRALLTQGIQSRSTVNLGQDQSGSVTSNGTALKPLQESLSMPSAQFESAPPKISGTEMAPLSTAVEIETEKHPVQTTEMQVVDKSVIEEQPVSQTKYQHLVAGPPPVVLDEQFDEDGDDWLKEETSEVVGSSNTTIPIGNDEDVSFSDLEDDDGDVPTSFKKVTSGSDSPTKDSPDWVQLGTSSGDSIKDVSCVGEKGAGSEQVSACNSETKESNDWLDIEEII